jgi:SAM-dependent methyltransferase
MLPTPTAAARRAKQPVTTAKGSDMHQDLEAEYRLRFEHMAGYRDRVWKVLTRHVFQAYVPKDGTVLDLGCGFGEFVNNIGARVKYGMDLNPESARRLSPNVVFLKQDCSTRWPLPDSTLDVIFTSNFFEHLPTKESLRETVLEARRCLRTGGTLICVGPNIKYLPGEYWDFWDHYLPLTELSMAELLEVTGFRVSTRLARFLPYSMSLGFAPPVAFVTAYLHLPFLWRFFGKQFLVVARKP